MNEVAPWVVAAVQAELSELPGRALGIGGLRAGIAMASALAASPVRPPAVILVGTAGAYPDAGLAVGQVVAGRRLGWGHGGATAGLGYVPAAPGPLFADEALGRAASVPRVDVLTVDAITTDPALTGTFGEAWAVEHMETWAVAWACREHGVPFVPILGLSNVVGPQAHAQWKAHRGEAEAAARAVVRRLLDALA